MDPISLVMTALAAGAISATKETAGSAVKDAYQGLKVLIKKKFAGETKAEMVLEEHATDPETYEAPLKKKLAEAGIEQDMEIVKIAQDLINQVKEQPGGQEIITQTQTNTVSGVNVGGNFEFKPVQEGKKS